MRHLKHMILNKTRLDDDAYFVKFIFTKTSHQNASEGLFASNKKLDI